MGDEHSSVIVAVAEDAEELRRCIALYRDTFAIPEGDAAITPRLLRAIQYNGGVVLSARLDGALVGFNYGFLGRETPAQELYLYSQLSVVAPAAQNRGVGRALKLAQRGAALARGLRCIRWTFDPVRARNGHFNLDVLGGVAEQLLPNFYGIEDSGRDQGVASDRLLVDWHLESRRVARSGQGTPPSVPLPPSPPAVGETRVSADVALLTIPAEWDEYRAAAAPDAARNLQQQVCEAFQRLFADGWRAVSCRRVNAATAVYRLTQGPIS